MSLPFVPPILNPPLTRKGEGSDGTNVVKIPPTVLNFCRGVPLDSSYRNIMHFPTRADQLKYFATVRKKHGSATDPNAQPYLYFDLTQMRLYGKVQIAQSLQNLQDVNYLYFLNPYFTRTAVNWDDIKSSPYISEPWSDPQVEDQQWYFAFIDKVEFVNAKCADIYFTIDVFNSFLNCWKIMPSYVSRETPETDNYFEHKIEENLDCGEYMISKSLFVSASKITSPGGTDGGWSSLFLEAKTDNDEIQGFTVGGKYFAPYFFYHARNPLAVAELKDYFTKYGYKVFAAYYLPTNLVNNMSSQNSSTLYTTTYNFAAEDKGFGNYIPKNKKLYNFPFNVIEISNNSESSLTLKPEFFKGLIDGGLVAQYSVRGYMGSRPEIVVAPNNYLGNPNNESQQMNISYDNFPQIPWSTNAYEQWYAFNGNRHNLNMKKAEVMDYVGAAEKGLNLIRGISTSGSNKEVVEGVASSGGGIAGSIVDAYFRGEAVEAMKKDYLNMPQTVSGYLPSSDFNLFFNRIGFSFYRKNITEDYARKIDSYFTRYGYRVDRVKTVDVTTLPRGYKYIRTQDANIVLKFDRGCTNVALLEIKSAFDRGLTIWKDPTKVGDYGEWLPK